MTPKERAERAARVMWSGDRASHWFGMELIDIDEGRAVMAMTVKRQHVNGHDICHGGVIFALADSAFAFACNSRNRATLAFHNSITYIAPARLGDRLTASAREVNRIGRSGITDVAMTNQDGQTIAEFRGVSRMIKGRLFAEETEVEKG
ncbi:MAG: hydroxyphenylacetyl-CoA thioesterase PaaI [Hyphomicrobiales bacterium]